MSLFRVHSPKTLWMSTLRLVNVLFHTPPHLSSDPVSYFTDILKAHQWIRHDISGIFEEEIVTDDNPKTSIGKIHVSLKELEKILFDVETEWPSTIEGCQKHTECLEKKLQTSTCVLS